LYTKKFNHVLVIDHVYGGINFSKYFYIFVKSLKTHYKNISLKIKLFFWFLNLKSFGDVDVNGPFLCLQNCGNSPPRKTFFTSLIFILMFS